MTEWEIQNALYSELDSCGHWLIVPNIYVYCWESDLFSILKSNYIVEHEIKTSLSDFKADFKKYRKHSALEKGYVILEHITPEKNDKGVYERVSVNKTYKRKRPNYFYYACPHGLIPLADIPKYAGLVYVGDKIETVKRAPLLHKETFNDIRSIAKKMCNRYWDWRRMDF